MPTEVLSALREALACFGARGSKAENDACLDRLIDALGHWPLGNGVEIKSTETAEGTAVELSLPKPKGLGTTNRRIDPECLLMLCILRVAGGRLNIEAHSPGEANFYLRLTLDRPRKERWYVSRLIAGTIEGEAAYEGKDYYDMRRRAYGVRSGLAGWTPPKLGRDEAKAGCLRKFEALQLQPDNRLPAGLNRDELALMIDQAFSLMDALER